MVNFVRICCQCACIRPRIGVLLSLLSHIFAETRPHDSNDVIHHVVYQDCCHTKCRFNHSCAPNAEYGVEEQGCMKVRMLRPVEQGEKAGADSQTRHEFAWIYVAAWIHHHLCVHRHTCIFSHIFCAKESPLTCMPQPLTVKVG